MCEPDHTNEQGLPDGVALNRIRNAAMWIMKPGERIGCPMVWSGALLEAVEYLEKRLDGGTVVNITDGTHNHFYGPIQEVTINVKQEHPRDRLITEKE